AGLYRNRDRNGAVYFNDIETDKLEESVGLGGVAKARGGRSLAGQIVNAPAASGTLLSLAETRREMKAPAEMAATPPGQAEPAVVVRSDFRSTIVWQPDVHTDAEGKATIKLKYPDSLTGWKATARAVSSGNQFGIANSSTRTKRPLIVRLQAPRFFLVGDTVSLSAVLN